MPFLERCFFDAAMGSEMTKGRGHTGITLFVGRTPVSCISKRQGTAEASSYGSEFIAGRISVEEVLALRGARRALGVPVKFKVAYSEEALTHTKHYNST